MARRGESSMNIEAVTLSLCRKEDERLLRQLLNKVKASADAVDVHEAESSKSVDIAALNVHLVSKQGFISSLLQHAKLLE
jgi:hypothetical protein